MKVRVLVLRSVKRGGEVVHAGAELDVSHDEVERYPQLYKPIDGVEAERRRATAQPAQEAEQRLHDHMAMRRALAAEEMAAQKARARLLAEQAEQAAKVAAEAARQAGLDPAAPAPVASPSPAAAPAAEPAELPPHRRGRARTE